MICTALRAAMIYQACGLDKKIPRTKFSVFWGWGTGILNQVLHQGSTCAKSLKCKTIATELRGGSHRIIQTKKTKERSKSSLLFFGWGTGILNFVLRSSLFCTKGLERKTIALTREGVLIVLLNRKNKRSSFCYSFCFLAGAQGFEPR